MPRAQIATKQATFTLDMLHRELAGKLLDNKSQGDRLREAMGHVEAVMKLLDPTRNLKGIAIRRRKPNPYFKRGTVFREVLSMLRQTGKPLTAREITLAILAAKGVKNAPDKAVRDLEGAVRASLRHHEGDSVQGAGTNPIRWQLRS